MSASLAEMYGRGVSTHNVKGITEEWRGRSVSPSTISRINERRDRTLTAFAGRNSRGRCPT
ncbi:MAG: hypothetical protein F4Y02_02990 [Chloroflexi bacterium]|nr:hypothetical protein [Chloroflexota bacterium]